MTRIYQTFYEIPSSLLKSHKRILISEKDYKNAFLNSPIGKSVNKNKHYLNAISQIYKAKKIEVSDINRKVSRYKLFNLSISKDILPTSGESKSANVKKNDSSKKSSSPLRKKKDKTLPTDLKKVVPTKTLMEEFDEYKKFFGIDISSFKKLMTSTDVLKRELKEEDDRLVEMLLSDKKLEPKDYIKWLGLYIRFAILSYIRQYALNIQGFLIPSIEAFIGLFGGIASDNSVLIGTNAVILAQNFLKFLPSLINELYSKDNVIQGFVALTPPLSASILLLIPGILIGLLNRHINTNREELKKIANVIIKKEKKEKSSPELKLFPLKTEKEKKEKKRKERTDYYLSIFIKQLIDVLGIVGDNMGSIVASKKKKKSKTGQSKKTKGKEPNKSSEKMKNSNKNLKKKSQLIGKKMIGNYNITEQNQIKSHYESNKITYTYNITTFVEFSMTTLKYELIISSFGMSYKCEYVVSLKDNDMDEYGCENKYELIRKDVICIKEYKKFFKSHGLNENSVTCLESLGKEKTLKWLVEKTKVNISDPRILFLYSITFW